MLKRHSQIFEGLFTASDLLVASAAWPVSYWLRFHSGLFEVDKGIPPLTDYLKILIFIWPLWAYVFRRAGLYRPMRGVSRYRELWAVARANSLSVLLLLALTYLFREKSVPFSRLVFLIFWAISTVFAISSRTIIRKVLRGMRRRGYNLRYALIVGAGPLALKVARRMRANREYGIELLGCLERDGDGGGNGSSVRFAARTAMATHADFPTVSAVAGAGASAALAAPSMLAAEVIQSQPKRPKTVQGVKIIGAYSDLPRLIEEGGIDQVIVALPISDHHLMEQVIGAIGDEIIDVRIVPDLHQFIQLGSQIEEFDGLPVISLASTPLSGVNRVVKRLMDLVLGTFLLVLTLPLMLCVAAAVKLTSSGPVFFGQERVGLDGRKFRILKFRTMYIDAESDGARFAVRGDPRATPLGRILRKFNVDELPQLVNVIRGQMSLVGPRPERPVFIQEFRRHVPKYMLRHKVQAGMTGWAQVHGWRGNTSIEKRIEHDLYYIENWSVGLDLRILGLTFLHSFVDRNAY